MATRQKRSWHSNFLDYMDFIVGHPTYAGMPNPFKSDGSVRWVVTGNSRIGRARREWWDRKREDLNIPKDRGWLSKAARELHPTGGKICQICGKEMKVYYIYPRKRPLETLNAIRGLKIEFTIFDEIDEIVEKVIEHLGDRGFDNIKRIFKIPNNIIKIKADYKRYIVEECRTKLSPGAMSNAPDRFDGFHTYNRCCRKEQDTGRHSENLERYIEDRRAYEHWAEGDWKAASWLMKGENGICPRCEKETTLTADHIGPISLGFMHRPKFQPLCRTCNSAKNNRMMLSDIEQLITDEESGDEVISWHSKPIWDLLKYKPNNDHDARKVSRLMRIYNHHVMEVFYIISINGFKDFLINFLNPEYAYYSIEFINLIRKTFQYTEIIKEKGSKKQYENNAARYVRIAFESLEEYHSKTIDNRRVKQIMGDREVKNKLHSLIKSLEKNEEYSNLKVRNILNEALEKTSKTSKEDMIKMALDEFNENPRKNRQAEKILNDTFDLIARKIVASFW